MNKKISKRNLRMKKISMVLCAIALVCILSGCSTEGVGGNWDGHYGMLDAY